MTDTAQRIDRQDMAGARELYGILHNAFPEDGQGWSEDELLHLCDIAHNMQRLMLNEPWDAERRPGDHLQVEAGAKYLYEHLDFGPEQPNTEPWETIPEALKEVYLSDARAVNQAMMREPWEIK